VAVLQIMLSVLCVSKEAIELADEGKGDGKVGQAAWHCLLYEENHNNGHFAQNFDDQVSEIYGSSPP
jgi:hypothetical protein